MSHSVYELKNLEDAERLVKRTDITEKRYLSVQMRGQAKLLYESEKKRGQQWRAVSTTAPSTYTRHEFWSFVEERAHDFFKEGKISVVRLVFFEGKKS